MECLAFCACIATPNRDWLVAQAFQPAGSGDFPVVSFWSTGLESPVNRQTGMSALHTHGSWRDPFRFLECIGTMNRSVGTPLVWSPAFRRSGPAKAGTPNGRFMESPLSFLRMHWDHEPRAVPRRTESADKSDGFGESHRAALQTLRAVRRRPAVAKRLECVRLQRGFSKAGCNSMAGPVHGEPPRL